MYKPIQVCIAVAIVICAILFVILLSMFISNQASFHTEEVSSTEKLGSTEIELPSEEEIRPEYQQQNEYHYTNYNILFSPAEIQAIEDNSGIVIDKNSGNIDLAKSDFINFPETVDIKSSVPNTAVAEAGDTAYTVVAESVSFQDYLSSMHQYNSDSIIEEQTDYIIWSGTSYYKTIDNPLTGLAVTISCDNLDSLKQVQLKDVVQND